MIWRYIVGEYWIELVCADPQKALALLLQHHIAIRRIEKRDELTVLFYISGLDYELLKNLSNKKDYKITVKKQTGLLRYLRLVKCRPIVVAGILLLALLVVQIPKRILFISVKGNSLVSEARIRSAAEERGIRFGASRKEVRSEKIKNSLLEAIPELQWAGINTAGCTAIISVRERITDEIDTDNHAGVSSIIADRDGIIRSCVAEKGNLLCTPGQAVRKGETLISGYINCGLCIKATQSKGEIFAETKRINRAILPENYLRTKRQSGVIRRYSIVFGKKRINLWLGSGIYDVSCDRMYKEYVLTLPGGYSLPLRIAVDNFSSRITEPVTIGASMAKTELLSFSQRMVCDRMMSGTIISKEEVVDHSEGRYLSTSAYSCLEMIGVVRWEQNGDYYGKNS